MSESFLPQWVQDRMSAAIRKMLEPFDEIDRQHELTERLGQVTCAEDSGLGWLPSGDESHSVGNLPCQRCGAAL